MNQPPEEKTETDIFPSTSIVQRLALNDSGFVFDPENGRSFTANEEGLYILRFLQKSSDAGKLTAAIVRDFDVRRANAERDITEFAAQLRSFLA